MALVTTSAVVLRTYPYSETSKIVRLATRDLGVQSAIAKGVLRPKSRFAAGLELLSEGVAQLYHRETRELQTLAAFAPLGVRRELAPGVRRLPGAPAPGEPVLQMGPPAPPPPAPDPPTPRACRARPPRDLAPHTVRPPERPALALPPAAPPRRLFPRFVRHHFGETSPPPPLDFWERHAWSPPPPSAILAPAPAPAPAP